MARVLLITGGNAEDLIGAALSKLLLHSINALPLVGDGSKFEKMGCQVVGPRISMPSGGFPGNSLKNLFDDIKAGLLTNSLKQAAVAMAEGKKADCIIVVGDSFSLLMGVLAKGGQTDKPLFHLQPQISNYYWGGRSTLERLKQLNQFPAEDYLFYERFMHRYTTAVYVRDKLSENRAQALGMSKAKFVGSMAMDTMGPPERDLSNIRDGRDVLVLLPGTRGDVGFSLPMMLEASVLLPNMQPLVAWANDFSSVPLPNDWFLEVIDEQTAIARTGTTKVWLVRGAFSAILHIGKITIGTAGTANEQSAGMGIPVVAFPTKGPQYIMPNALRQSRLLGEAIKLVEADPAKIASSIKDIFQNPQIQKAAVRDGLERNGPPGALREIANEINTKLNRR